MGAYAPPMVGSTGLVIPTYAAILNWLIAQYLATYGSSVYLGTDSADYQDLAIRALQANDANALLQAVWLSFNPLTAIGTSLDLLGKLIGTSRNQATYSTALLTVTGTSGTVITNGAAQDTAGNFWNLPGTVTIPSGGSINVTATAANPGNISANPGAIIIIATPTAGWTGVTNPGAAILGEPVEPDSQYRARLLISQAKPSLTLLAGTTAAVAAVTGVTRSEVYENQYGYTTGFGLVNTSGTAVTLVVGYAFDSSDVGQTITISGVSYTIASVSSGTSLALTTSAGTQTSVAYSIGDGIALGPAHSITCVVENGTHAAIAQAIYDNKNPGVLTNGSTAVTVTDPLNGNISIVISFDVLAYVPIYVSINVHALSGFTSATQAAVASDLVAYLNSLGIGESVVFSELYGAALNARPNPDQPLFSIRAILSGYQSAQTTGSTTSGSASVALTSGAGVAVGQTVVGSGIPNNTTVAAISGTSLTLSANATATASGVPLSFFTTGTSDIPVGYAQAAQGEALNVVVNLV